MSYKKLLLASSYAFDDSGNQDIRKLVESLDTTLSTTFLPAEQLFVIEGDIDKKMGDSCITRFREYLEKHAHENLLDAPPIRPLDRFHPRKMIPAKSAKERASVDDLLDLNEAVAAPAARFAQTWEPSVDMEQFAADRWGILSRLALEHDVKITVESSNNSRGQIRVSGTSQDYVQAAIAKIAALEKPLSFFKQPYRGLIFIAPRHELSAFSIVRYSSIGQAALQRVLVDQDSTTARDIPEMLAPVLLSRDAIVPNIQKPTQVEPTSNTIRAWRDYRFPEIGDRGLYAQLATASRLSRKDSPPAPENSPDHAFYRNARVQPVDDWKVDISNLARVSLNPEELEASSRYAREPQPGSITIPRSAAGSTASMDDASVPKLPPGIKTRKVLARAKDSPGVSPAPNIPPKAKETPSLSAGKTTAELQKMQPKSVMLIDISEDTPVTTSKPESETTAKRTGIREKDSSGTDMAKSNPLSLIDLPIPASYNFLSPVLGMDDKPPVDNQPSASPKVGVTSMGNRTPESPLSNLDVSSCISVVSPSASKVHADLQSPTTETKPSSRAHDENEAWARKFLLKEIQASSEANIWNDYLTAFPAGTPPEYSRALAADSQLSAEGKAKGEIHERLATGDEKPRVLHSLMRNKAPRRRFFGWQKSALPPSPTVRIDVVPDLVQKRPPLSSTGSQPKLHNSTRLLSAERIHLLKSLFQALKPLLEAASFYPGSLSLEFQLGLVLIPRPSQSLEGRYKDLDKLQSKLLPRTGLPAPTTIFFDRLTASAADVDYIIDLEVHNARIFAPEPTQLETRFEFHCDTEAGDLVIVVYVDGHSERMEMCAPPETLGSVHMSFPGQVWDAAVVIRGEMKHPLAVDPEIQKRARHIVNTLWAESDQGRVRILASIPKDKLSVKKVFMKRCTHYRHCLRQDDSVLDQDIFLKVTETQDLIIRHFKNEEVIEAYCAVPGQMEFEHRRWWQVSIVNPVLNSALKPNGNHPPGSPGEWSVLDLLGNDKDLLFNETSNSPGPSLPGDDPARQSSSTAASIGSTGIGSLLFLTEAVVASIDAVGYWNSGPGAVPAATSTSRDASSSQPVKPPSRPKTPTPNTNRALVLRIPRPREHDTGAEGLVRDPSFW